MRRFAIITTAPFLSAYKRQIFIASPNFLTSPIVANVLILNVLLSMVSYGGKNELEELFWYMYNILVLFF